MVNKKESGAVAELSEIIALKSGMHPYVAKRLRMAAALHDVGKIKIPESILNKPEKLTEQEYEIVMKHTTIGANLLKSIKGELGVMARIISLFHHEFYDGSGYFGKHTCALPVYVPIVTICDTVVALLSERPYKAAWPLKEAVEYVGKQAGSQFNPALVEIFLSLVQNDASTQALLSGLGLKDKSGYTGG